MIVAQKLDKNANKRDKTAFAATSITWVASNPRIEVCFNEVPLVVATHGYKYDACSCIYTRASGGSTWTKHVVTYAAYLISAQCLRFQYAVSLSSGDVINWRYDPEGIFNPWDVPFNMYGTTSGDFLPFTSLFVTVP